MNDIKRYNSKIIRALVFAAKAHEGQFRKGTDIPYIVHPVEVAMILQENGASEDLIVAGLLHDTLEDTKVTPMDIRVEFGQKVLDLVLGASEQLEGRENRPWEERKKHTLEYLENADLEVKLIACADKLSNIRAMLRDYEYSGNLWERFTVKDPQKHQWYYQGLVKSLGALCGYAMYEEFKETVDALFKKVEGDA